MLAMMCKLGESIKIGDDVIIKITQIKGGQTRVAIEAPKHIQIARLSADETYSLLSHYSVEKDSSAS